LLAAATGAAAICATATAMAGARGYDDDDLKGEFICAVQRNCTAFSVIGTFDGNGQERVTGSYSFACPGAPSGPTPMDVPQYYSVNPDGSFSQSDSPDLSNPASGQLVDHGRTLLYDGKYPGNALLGICMKR
jgi:hypothetical protein